MTEMNDPHLLPDGSTSWGPDPDPDDTDADAPHPYHEVESAEVVPEPTEAMVEAAFNKFTSLPWVHPSEGADPTAIGVALATGLKDTLEAAIAAAPPEWLLRAALTEDEIRPVLQACNDEAVPILYADHYEAAITKLSRALRGGEETNG